MDKREAILEAAERRFYAAGFHATGIDRVVADAGVTPRTLYRHFASKEDLVRAVLVRREERFLALLDRVLDAPAAGEAQRWQGLFEGLGDWFREQGARGCLFLRALGEYAEHDDAIAGIAVEHKRRVLDGFRRRLAAAGFADARGRAESLALLLEGAVAMAAVTGPEPAQQRAAALAADLFAPGD